jgi:hypothetical protein
MEADILIILAKTFIFMVIVVGGYLYLFLNVMRVDPREQEFRKKLGHEDTLVPHKYKSELKTSKEKQEPAIIKEV